MKVHYQGKELPNKAGAAILKYGEVKQPLREGEVITLPSEGWDLYQLLPDFSQFIAMKEKPERSDSRYTEHRQAYFGGTDEKPFLVQLDGSANLGAWTDVWREGTFFEAIKPEIIGEFERLYGIDQTMRRGDIFAYPMPIQDWDKLVCVLKAGYEGFDKAYYDNARDVNLFGTRHLLKKGSTFARSNRGKYIIADGTIEAPDHSPLILGKTICVLAQTENLYNPKQAD